MAMALPKGVGAAACGILHADRMNMKLKMTRVLIWKCADIGASILFIYYCIPQVLLLHAISVMNLKPVVTGLKYKCQSNPQKQSKLGENLSILCDHSNRSSHVMDPLFCEQAYHA